MTAYQSLTADIKSSMSNFRVVLQRYKDLLALVEQPENKAKFESIQHDNVTVCGYCIDFNSATREQKRDIILAFPGVWEKDTDCGSIMNYIRKGPFGEHRLRLYDAALPPSCALIKRTRIVPEREETYTEIVCGKDEDDNS